MLITLFLSGMVAIRAITMFYWGIRRRLQGWPDSLQEATPWRLFLASSIMLPLAFLCLGMGMAFQSSFVGFGESYSLDDLKEVVAYQIAYAQLAEQETGKAQFHRPSDPASYIGKFGKEYSPDRFFHPQVKFDDLNEGFTVYLPALLPFFPYNYLTSAPTYYGDETGKIRMIRVHDSSQYCPADAPIVQSLTSEDIAKKTEEIFEARRREEKYAKKRKAKVERESKE